MATSAAIPKPRKAEKKRVKLKMAVQGPSGSGKTWGALSLAKNLWPDAKVCLIDTENESASLYADQFDFDTIPLGPPFTTERYVWAIDEAVREKYDVLIIDTITAQWDGEGGILRRKEEMERRNPGVNGYTLWARFTPEHEAFKQVMLQAPIHVIATMRSKQEYALQTNDKGKQVPVKMGLAPIQRDQIDYEFTLVFDLNINHMGQVSKDRTGLFNDKTIDLQDPKIAESIAGWLSKGKEDEQVPVAGPSLVQRLEASVAVEEAKQAPAPPPVASDFFTIVGDRLSCIPVEVFEKTSSNKGKPFIHVTLNGEVPTPVGKATFASCWDTKLFDALKNCVDQKCLFEFDVDARGYVKVTDVFNISGEDYKDGKPVA
ncbi:MAG TPA: AAA family ATPase [Nitrospira sp.]|nr:AAA family ATPase [Nitrospira sp.]